MSVRTLTITNADGSSETYTIDRTVETGVRTMTVDGSPVSVDHTAFTGTRTMTVDGQPFSVDHSMDTDESVRSLTIDGEVININRSRTPLSTPTITSVPVEVLYRTFSGGAFYQPDGNSKYIPPTS